MVQRRPIAAMLAVAALVAGGVFFAATASEARSELRVGGFAHESRAAAREARTDRFRADEIIVRFRGDERFQRVRLSSLERVESALERFRGRPDVLYAEPNYIAHAFFVPNDTYYPFQWHFDNDTYGGVHAQAAWDTERGAGATVAVIDTGVAYENYTKGWWLRYYRAPDLADTSFVAGYDFVENDTHPNDDNGHGTHVAGTVAQSTDNDLGVAGLAHKASVMPVKVLDSRGSGTYADVADGIRWAADKGADVINLSLGGPSPASYLEEALAYAYDKGVTIVAAAGNDGSNSISYPAAYDDYVIAVGATRFDETKAPYSNYGASLDLVAPGGDTSVDQNGDGYGDGVLQQTFGRRLNDWGYYFYQGTSMATPHVAGTAALLIANGTASAPSEVREALQSTAQDLGAAGRDNTYGYGLINAAAALGWSAGLVDNPPTVSITAPSGGSTNAGSVVFSADASDDNGVDHVAFYADGSLITEDATAPYEVSWDSTSVSDGSHTLKAVAVDTAGQTAQDSVAVSVDNVNDAPAADAGADQTLSDDDGSGDESATLDGSGSSDPDGVIDTYEWSEGGVVLGTGETLTADFSVGTHAVVLTVTDDDGALGSDEAVVTVQANEAPSAEAGADKTVVVNESVSFDGSGSSDSDGSITDYAWDFGDGATATGSGESVSHSYGSAGEYAVALTVTDNGGLTDDDTLTVTVGEEAPPPETPPMHVGDITFSSQKIGFFRPYCQVTASVPILDASGSGVSGAQVSGSWSGAYSRSVSGTTGGSGTVSFTTRWTRGCGTFTLEVASVEKEGWEYDAASNVETSDSVTP